MEGNKNELTAKDVLVEVSKLLCGINVPMSLFDSIGIPVAKAINGVQMCIKAYEEQEKAEEMKIENVEVGTTDQIPEGESNNA